VIICTHYFLKVTVACAEAAGTECNEIEPPSGQCAVGNEINTVRFKYTESSCERGEGDLNSQNDEDGFTCDDFNGGPPADEEVLITVSEGNTTVFAIMTVTVGDDIVVPSGTDATGPLPESITCVVTSTDGLTTYQEVTINTSGKVDLYLKDKFGSLKLESCDDNDCLVTVNYLYTLENIGTTPMTIAIVDRERDGEVEDLLALVPDAMLGVGDKTTVTETEQVDICVNNKSTTKMEVEADSPAGFPCFAEAEYSLVTEGGCRVDAEISCIAGEGIECDKLVPPTNPEDCVVPASYSYTVRNIGTTNMTITSANVTINDNDPVNILDAFDTEELAPGDGVIIGQQMTIDFCSTEETTVTFDIKANAVNGTECNDTDVYVLAPTPPTPTPPPVTTPQSEPTPSEPTSTESTASEPTPSQPTPSELAPTEPTPSEPTPSEPTPAEPTPSEPTPSEPTSSEATPTEPTLSEPTSS
jgi:hypothetical protein